MSAVMFTGKQLETARGERMLMRYLAEKAEREGLPPVQDPAPAPTASHATFGSGELTPEEHARLVQATFDNAETEDSIPDITDPFSRLRTNDANEEVLAALRNDPKIVEQVVSAGNGAAPERAFGQLPQVRQPSPAGGDEEPLSLSPLMRDASRLEQHIAACETAVGGGALGEEGDPAAVLFPAEGLAGKDNADVLKELTLSRQVAEHLKTRVHGQQCEIHTLRDKIRLFGEAKVQDGHEALVVVLSQLADSERAVAALRASVDEKQRSIAQLRSSMADGQTLELVAKLQVQLQEVRDRNAVLEAENRCLKEERDTGALGAGAQERLRHLQKANASLKEKVAGKEKSLKDMAKLLQLHLSLRGGVAENQMRQLMAGSAAASRP